MDETAPLPETVTAMIMAGKRSGALDPLAARAGVAQKCVVPVLGVPMVERVARNVAACPLVRDMIIVAHEPDEIAAIPFIADLVEQGRLRFAAGKFNLVDSVREGAKGATFPIMITTADNCLVTPQGYEEFIAKALQARAGGAAALARKEDVIAADPEGQKKFYKFADGEFSNCNTYWIGAEQTLSAAEIFRNGGQFVKKPHRIAKAFGIVNLIRFFIGNANREELFDKMGRRFGFKLASVVLSNGEYAIDVDNQRTFEVTERLLAKREGAGTPA